jgi:hypothetical protein
MKQDSTDFSNLQDLVLPPDATWWPLAAGWWILLLFVAAAVIALLLRLWIWWRSNSYRRAAMKELQRAQSVAEIAAILKRTAMCRVPRSQIARLSGEQWCDWLQLSGGTSMPDSVRSTLSVGVFSDHSESNIKPLQKYAQQWISRHEISPDPPAVQQ